MPPSSDIPNDDMRQPLDMPPTAPRHTPARRHSRKRLIGAIAAVVLLLCLAGAAVWFFGFRDSSMGTQNKTATDANGQQPEPTEPTLSPEEAAQIEIFKSETLALELSHRRDWQVQESADKQTITLISAPLAFQSDKGNVPKSRGVFKLSITREASDQARQAIDKAVAVRDSVLIAYAAPTEEQRHYTNVSFAGPDISNFEFLVVSGSSAYKPGDPLAGTLSLSAPGFYLITGGYGVTSEEAVGNLGYYTVPASSIEQGEAFNQAIAIVESLKLY